MTDFIPFPPQLAEISARNANSSYKATKSIGPKDHKIVGVAAFRTQEGVLRAAHDIYNPQYPKGSTPGIATLDCRLQYHANETHFYDTRVLDFVDAPTLLADSNDWDNPCVTVVNSEGTSFFAVAKSESELQDILDTDAVLRFGRREKVVCCGWDGVNPPLAMVSVSTRVTSDIYISQSLKELCEALSKRHSHLQLDTSNPTEALADFVQKAKALHWETMFMTFDEAQKKLEPARDAMRSAADQEMPGL